MINYTYEKVLLPTGEENTELIKRLEDGAFIPTNLANSDYQAYLNKDKQQVEHLTDTTNPVEGN